MSSEMIEVFDDQGSLLGTQPRKVVHAQGHWHKGVHGFLFDEAGRLLIQKRSNGCDTFPGAIDCSLSEHLMPGESFESALLRGCREELGLKTVRPTQLITYKMPYGPTDNMIGALYKTSISVEELILNRSEVESIQFIELESLRERLKSGQAHFTKWFYHQLLWYFGESRSLPVV
jgi:isopentenyldiphosphate isomerase